MAFSWYKTVTVDKTKVPSTQTDFPVLVSVTDADLKTVGNGGFVQNSSGFDVGFYADSAAATKYDWETERYIATTGEVIYHVRIPSLSSATDTVFYMFFGDSGISTDQSNKTGVWDSNFKGVYHLPDGTTLTADDSTSNARHGTLINTPTADTGKVGGAAAFDAASAEYITIPNSIAVANTSAFTLSAWCKVASTKTGIIYAEGRSSSTDPILLVMTGNVAAGDATAQHRDDTTSSSYITNSLGLDDGTWHKYDYVRTAANAAELFTDDVSRGTDTTTIGTTTVDQVRLGVLSRISDALWITGSIDEVRISSIARSNNWKTTEYNNQSSPSTFESFGAKTAAGGDARTLAYLYGQRRGLMFVD